MSSAQTLTPQWAKLRDDARLRGEVNQWGLTEKDCEIIRNVLSKNIRITRAILYGSRAMGTFRKASDVDLALEGENLEMHDVASVRRELEESSLPFEVDVIIRAEITNTELEKQIEKYGKTLYCIELQDGT